MATSILRSRIPQGTFHLAIQKHPGKPLSYAAERSAFKVSNHTRNFFYITSPLSSAFIRRRSNSFFEIPYCINHLKPVTNRFVHFTQSSGEVEVMKKLPIGIQSIREILEEKQIYVDKTGFALNLISKGKHYFMSRPRRFGKSLFINTLEEIFKGNKDLFKDCKNL